MRNAATLKISSLTLLALGLGATAGAVSLVSNGGFESGVLSPWFSDSNSSGTDWAIATDQTHSGTHSATVSGDALLQQNFAPTATESITDFSAWVKQDPGALFVMSALYSDGTTTDLFGTPSRTNFIKYDLTDQLDPGKMVVAFQMYGYDGGANGPTWIDDVSVQATPEPASMAVLGMGALAMMRRRKKA